MKVGIKLKGYENSFYIGIIEFNSDNEIIITEKELYQLVTKAISRLDLNYYDVIEITKLAIFNCSEIMDKENENRIKY